MNTATIMIVKIPDPNIIKPPPREVKEHPNRYLQRSHNTTWSEQLKHDLLKNYDRYLRPDQELGVTHVNLSMVFKNIDLVSVNAHLISIKKTY